MFLYRKHAREVVLLQKWQTTRKRYNGDMFWDQCRCSGKLKSGMDTQIRSEPLQYTVWTVNTLNQIAIWTDSVNVVLELSVCVHRSIRTLVEAALYPNPTWLTAFEGRFVGLRTARLRMFWESDMIRASPAWLYQVRHKYIKVHSKDMFTPSYLHV